MKLVTAIIQPDKLEAVQQALTTAQIYRITVGRVTGHGRQVEEGPLSRAHAYSQPAPKGPYGDRLQRRVCGDCLQGYYPGGQARERGSRGRQDLRHQPGGVHPNPHRRAGRRGDLIQGDGPTINRAGLTTCAAGILHRRLVHEGRPHVRSGGSFPHRHAVALWMLLWMRWMSGSGADSQGNWR